MALDPIVSLAVAIAEAPGSCACVLGAGVSVDAGVPTGWSIYRDGLRRLYRLENEVDEAPNDEAIDDWLAKSGRADLGYSALLDLIAPDAAIRRSLLAGYFKEAEPGTSHLLLAEMAARGLIRVFVTTNFDRLLEGALATNGIDPVVISDDASLQAAPRREHADVYVVKAHGDYLQETIRNTPSELVGLEPDLTDEIRRIFDNYGLVVIGWSGSDPALAQLVDERRSRYGAWWLSLSDPQDEPARTLAERAGIRVIHRSGASALLGDLDRRLAVYEAHPEADDPGSVHDEVRTLLRRSDAIALDEILRRERAHFETAVEGVSVGHRDHHDNPDHVCDATTRLMAATQRRLASLVPLAVHRPDLLDSELRSHAAWASSDELVGGGMTWQQAWVVPFWVLGMALGGLAVRLDRYAAIRPLVSTSWNDYNSRREPFIGHPGNTGAIIAGLLGPTPEEGRTWLFPQWQWLLQELDSWVWLAERYPDWLQRKGEPAVSMACFDFLLGLAESLRKDGGGVWAVWTLRQGAVGRFARRLHADSSLRAEIAEALGSTLEDFDERAPAIVENSTGLGGFPDVKGVASILRTGQDR